MLPDENNVPLASAPTVSNVIYLTWVRWNLLSIHSGVDEKVRLRSGVG